MKYLLSPCLVKCSSARQILIPLISVIIIAITQFFYCADHRNKVLAVVGNRTVTVDDYVTRYQMVRQKINLPDNGQVRNEILRKIVDEELLIGEAIRRGYRDDSSGKLEYERLKVQELLTSYQQNEIFDKIAIHEEELKALYQRFNTKIKARHLYAASRKQADSLYDELSKGRTFAELAKDVFTDPQLRSTGGALGYFTVDEMDPAFEDAAFNLNVGQLSKPVKTAQGYSIIQVQDRISNPLLTESEYEKQRAKLADYCRYRKRIKATQSYVDSLRKNLNISFNEPVVNALLQIIKNRTADSISEDDHIFYGDEKIQNQAVVDSKLGVWDVEALHQYAQFTSAEQLKWIRNQENLEDYFAGLVVRTYMLTQAKAQGLQQSDGFKKNVEQKLNEYLLRRMEQIVSETTTIPEDSLRWYFQQHPEQFSIPPRIHLSEIVLDDEATTREIQKMLMNKVFFEKIAWQHSVRRWSGDQNGDIGSFSYDELGSYAERIFALKVGEWLGPLKMDSQYAFFKCVGREPQQARTFAEARFDLINSLKPIWQNNTKKALLTAICTKVQVVTYPDRLKTIQLN